MNFEKRGTIEVSEPTHTALKHVNAIEAVEWLDGLVKGRQRIEGSIVYDLSKVPNFEDLATQEPKAALLKIASELGFKAKAVHRSLATLEAALNAAEEAVVGLTIPFGVDGVSITVKEETHELLVQSCKLYLNHLGMAHEELELVLENSSSGGDTLIAYHLIGQTSSPVRDSIESLLSPLRELYEILKVSHRALMRACQAVHMESLSQSDLAEFGLDHHGSVGNFDGEPFAYSYSEEVLTKENKGYIRRSKVREVPFRIARVDLSNTERVDFVLSGLREMVGKE